MLRSLAASHRTRAFFCLCLLFMTLAPASARAVEPVKVFAADAKDDKGNMLLNSGDNAWMLTSSALVLMMTGPGTGAVLQRAGPPQERAGHHDAELHADGRRQRRLGTGRRTAWRSITARPSSAVSGSLSCATSATTPCEYAPTIPHTTWMVYQCMFAVITPAPDLRRVCRADEVQRDAGLHRSCGCWCVYCPMAHMVWGKGGLFNSASVTPAGNSRRSTSPAGRSCISARAFRRWSARWFSASGAGTAASRCRRTASCLSVIGAACSGSAGSASTPAAH